MKTKTLIPAILLLLTLSTSSCERILWSSCTSGECITVNVRGRLHIVPSGEGLSGVYVEVWFAGASTPIGGLHRRVASGRTNSNGEFDFEVRINPNQGRSLRAVFSPNQENYLYLGNESTIFGTFSDGDTINFSFEFFRKAPLTINLNRTQTDRFDRFYVRSGARSHGRFAANNSINITDSDTESITEQITTAANVYTIINWQKQLNGRIVYHRSDSIIARPNASNVFTIDF